MYQIKFNYTPEGEEKEVEVRLNTTNRNMARSAAALIIENNLNPTVTVEQAPRVVKFKNMPEKASTPPGAEPQQQQPAATPPEDKKQEATDKKGGDKGGGK